MAFRLNHLFQTAPLNVLARTVIFADGLEPARMRNKLTHFIDLEPAGKHARARVLAGLHEYQQDAPLQSYFAGPGVTALIPRDDPPYRFVFLPEFTNCRLLVAAEGDNGQYLRLQVEENLVGRVPGPGEKYLDSFGYWDYTEGLLVGVVRGTAVLFKEAGAPWTVCMQQIIGIPGNELVRQVFSRRLMV